MGAGIAVVMGVEAGAVAGVGAGIAVVGAGAVAGVGAGTAAVTGLGGGAGAGAFDTTILLVRSDFWPLRFLTVSRRYCTPDRWKVCGKTFPRPSGRNRGRLRLLNTVLHW